MNSPEILMNDPKELTVAEYAALTGESENTIRTRINRKKLKTTRGIRDNRECILILVDPSVDHSIHGSEQSKIPLELSGTVQNGPLNSSGNVVDHSKSFDEQSIIDAEFFTSKPNVPNELFGFMNKALDRVEAFGTKLADLSRENERYKLISDSSTAEKSKLEKQIEDLKDVIEKKDARISELETQHPDFELQAHIKQLQAQLAEQSMSNSANNSALDAEQSKENEALQIRFTELEKQYHALQQELAAERSKKKSWFGWGK